MKFTQAAVIEPSTPRYKALCAGLKKAGLKVSAARLPAELGREQVVVVGASVPSPSRVAREVRKAAPQALVLAARSRGFAAPWADAAFEPGLNRQQIFLKIIKIKFLRKPIQ